jgi:hypothetical protein
VGDTTLFHLKRRNTIETKSHSTTIVDAHQRITAVHCFLNPDRPMMRQHIILPLTQSFFSIFSIFSVSAAMPPGRTRRATAKAIDYAKQQEFSDPEDLFEDEPPEPPTTEKKRGRPRKHKAIVETEEDEGVVQSEKPLYTEKGYDSSLPPLRERFPFLPEFEEDGSPKIELIVGRRPIDEKEDPVKEDSDNGAVDSADDDTPKPARKTRARAGKDTTTGSPHTKTTNEGQVIEYEYLIKYRGRSYLHLEWKRGADLESMNKSAKGIYRRFLKKLEAGVGDMEELESPEVDPSYVVPEKIIDEADQEITVELSDKELLKWEKEREKDIEAGKKDVDDDDEDTGKSKNESKSPKKDAQADKDVKPKKEDDDGMLFCDVTRVCCLLTNDGDRGQAGVAQRS